jgi:hypothetical protein
VNNDKKNIVLFFLIYIEASIKNIVNVINRGAFTPSTSVKRTHPTVLTKISIFFLLESSNRLIKAAEQRIIDKIYGLFDSKNLYVIGLKVTNPAITNDISLLLLKFLKFE